MNQLVNILVDHSALSRNALLGFVPPNGYEVRIVELDIEDLDANSNQLANLMGDVLSLLSPQTFSLYRGKVYQLLSLNKNIKPFEFSVINQTTKIGRWSVVGENTQLSSSARVGLSTYVGPNCILGANVTIGNFCWLGEGVALAPGVVIGNNVTIHDGVRIGTASKIGKFNELKNNVPAGSELIAKRIETNFYGATAFFYGA